MSDPNPVQDLSHLRDRVVAELRAALPGVKSIEPHGGTFDEKEIGRHATQAPAIRVAIMGCGRCQRHNDGMVLLPVNLSAMVVTRDTVEAGRKVDRDTQAMLVANAVALFLYGDRNRFDLELVYAPENVTVRNEYSGAVLGAGLALWQVTWTSSVCLGASIDDAIAALVSAALKDLSTGETIDPYVDFSGSAP